LCSNLLTTRLPWFVLGKASSRGQNSYKVSEANMGVWPGKTIIRGPKQSESRGVWGYSLRKEGHTKARAKRARGGGGLPPGKKAIRTPSPASQGLCGISVRTPRVLSNIYMLINLGRMGVIWKASPFFRIFTFITI
jgi:hypothetical protein